MKQHVTEGVVRRLIQEALNPRTGDQRTPEPAHPSAPEDPASRFLGGILSDGPRDVHDIRRAADSVGILWDRVEWACARLDVRIHRAGGSATWELPLGSDSVVSGTGETRDADFGTFPYGLPIGVGYPPYICATCGPSNAEPGCCSGCLTGIERGLRLKGEQVESALAQSEADRAMAVQAFAMEEAAETGLALITKLRNGTLQECVVVMDELEALLTAIARHDRHDELPRWQPERESSAAQVGGADGYTT